jgi:hypothetical protein
MTQAPFFEVFKKLIESIFHRDCGGSESECDRLKQMLQHYNSTPSRQQPASKGRLSLPHRSGNNLRLVAYTKYGGETNTAKMQTEQINDYCALHNYIAECTYNWNSKEPAMALHEALCELEHKDGLIVADLSRLVEHHGDPLRDLQPLVHDHFFHNAKHLISVKEGIDTSTTPGQQCLIEYLKELQID